MSKFDEHDPISRPLNQPFISAATAEALLAGTPDAATTFDPDLIELRRLLDAARQPGAPDELASMANVIATFRGAFDAADRPQRHVEDTPMRRRRRLKPKVIVTASAITLLSAGAAAAATGNLTNPFFARSDPSVPSRITDPASSGSEVAAIGSPVPGAASESTIATADTTLTGAGTGTGGIDSSGPPFAASPFTEMCAAYAASGHDASSASNSGNGRFQDLSVAASQAGQSVDEFCTTVDNGSANSVPATGTVPAPAANAPGQTGESPSATAPGQIGESPANTAPGQSGESPSDTAPGQTGQPPAATAPGQGGEPPANTAPGQTEPPAATAPGQGGEPPAVTAPGQGGEPPSATAPAQEKNLPAATAPGQADEPPSATASAQASDTPAATAPGQSEDSPAATAPRHASGQAPLDTFSP